MSNDEKAMTYQGEESTSENTEKKSQSSFSLKNLFCRVYLVSFCIYMVAYNLNFYTCLNVAPFFLHNVFGVDATEISYLLAFLTAVICIGTILTSVLFQILDKYMTWLKCRMLFALLPMIVQMACYFAFAFVQDFWASAFLMTFIVLGASALFCGSILTIYYELDQHRMHQFS